MRTIGIMSILLGIYLFLKMAYIAIQWIWFGQLPFSMGEWSENTLVLGLMALGMSGVVAEIALWMIVKGVYVTKSGEIKDFWK